MTKSKEKYVCVECGISFKHGYQLGGHIRGNHIPNEGGVRDGPPVLSPAEHKAIDKETRRLLRLYKK